MEVAFFVILRANVPLFAIDGKRILFLSLTFAFFFVLTNDRQAFAGSTPV